MMKIYKILLPEEIEVKQRIDLNDGKIEIVPIKHQDCFDKMNKLSIDKENHNMIYGFPLSNSEVLNFITHYQVWKRFVKTNDDWCLIVESNVNLPVSAGNFLDLIKRLNGSDTNWDIFFPYNPFEIEAKNRKGGDLINVNSKELKKYYYYYLNFKWGNSIYFLSRKGAIKLLQIDKIQDRLDNTLLTLVSEEKINLYYETMHWFDYENINQFEWLERCLLMLKKIEPTISWDESSISKVRDIIRVISDISSNKHIDILLQGGTHLGYIRHGGIIPWDDDVDLGIEEKNLDLFFSELKTKKGYLSAKFIEPNTFVPYYKIWKEDGIPIDGYEYTFPFIDIWVFNIVENDIRFKNGIICPNSAKEKNIDILFEGYPLKITYNSGEVLDSRYSDWRNHLHIYNWSHKMESTIRNLMCIPIKTDDKGRANFPPPNYFNFMKG